MATKKKIPPEVVEAVSEIPEVLVVEKPKTKKVQKKKMAIVSNCVALNIRKEPTKDSVILQRVYAGDILTVKSVDKKLGWAIISTDDVESGYVMIDYIIIHEQVSE